MTRRSVTLPILLVVVALVLTGPAPTVANQTDLPPQEVAQSDLGPMRGLRSDEADVQLELPESWIFQVVQDGSYFFEGPEGSDAAELAVIIRFLNKSENPDSSKLIQLGMALRQVLSLPGAELRRLDEVEVSGQQAPFFLATYAGKDSSGESTAFAHTQMVLEYGDLYYWLAFFGPKEIYDKYSPVFQHILGTLRLGEE